MKIALDSQETEDKLAKYADQVSVGLIITLLKSSSTKDDASMNPQFVFDYRSPYDCLANTQLLGLFRFVTSGVSFQFV